MGEPAATTAVVLQPGYLPWLGFFDQMRRADVFVYYDDVQFDKNGWRNRNRVKSTDGRPCWLTVPVRHRGEGRPAINRIGIDRRAPWARKHVGTLRQHYSAAPHREPYLSELERTLSRDWTRLVDLNCEVTRLMAGWRGITTPTVLASELNVEGRRSGARMVARPVRPVQWPGGACVCTAGGGGGARARGRRRDGAADRRASAGRRLRRAGSARHPHGCPGLARRRTFTAPVRAGDSRC